MGGSVLPRATTNSVDVKNVEKLFLCLA